MIGVDGAVVAAPHENEEAELEPLDTTLEVLRRLEAEADFEALCTTEGRLLEELEAGALAPRLETLAYLPALEVAETLLRVLRHLEREDDGGDKASTSRAAELRALSWAHEWLALPPTLRFTFARLLMEGLARLQSSVQALHLEFITELLLARWEVPEEEYEQRRLARGLRMGRAAVVVLASLDCEELDELGKASSDTLSEHLTPLGAAKAVVSMSPTRRKQLAKVLVYEKVLSPEASLRLFRSITRVVDALGIEKLEATLTGLDTAVYVGGGAVRASGYALGTLGSLSSDALGTLSTVSVGVIDVLANAAAASAVVASSALRAAHPVTLANDTDLEEPPKAVRRPSHAGDFL